MNINADSNFISNSADEGGGLHAFDATVNISRDSNFMYNSIGGVLVAVVWRWHFNMLQGRTVFSINNAPYGGAIQAIEANINVTGSVDFTKNLATVNGGALALAGGSVVYIFETALLTFVENRAASFGGAIYIEDNSVHCSYDWNINGFIGIIIMIQLEKKKYPCRVSDSISFFQGQN